MTNQNKLDRIGATPGKLALVAVLAAVFVGVIVKQLPSSDPPPPAAVKPVAKQQPKPRAETPPTPVVATKDVSSAKQEELPPWPQIDLEESSLSDPFATPEWAIVDEPEPEIATPERIDELQKQGVSIVMIAGGGKSAFIGDQRVRIGDVLEGYRITDITSKGVVLNKLDQR